MRGLFVFAVVAFFLPIVANAQFVDVAHSDSFQKLVEINNALQQNQTREAIHAFKKMISDSKTEKQSGEVVETYFGFALALALNENYRQSIRYHKKAIRLHKKLHKNEPLEMYINLGLTYYLADKERKARKILGNSI
jgi:Flp pilus assembly protein TadD